MKTPQVLLVQFSFDANIHGDPLLPVHHYSQCMYLLAVGTKNTSHCVSVLCQERVL
jgi:hypothetical protein